MTAAKAAKFAKAAQKLNLMLALTPNDPQIPKLINKLLKQRVVINGLNRKVLAPLNLKIVKSK